MNTVEILFLAVGAEQFIHKNSSTFKTMGRQECNRTVMAELWMPPAA